MAALDTPVTQHRITGPRADAGAQPIPPLTEVEHWLLRIARGGLRDTSDMSLHTGLSEARVHADLDGAMTKLGATSLSDAIAVAERRGILSTRASADGH